MSPTFRRSVRALLASGFSAAFGTLIGGGTAAAQDVVLPQPNVVVEVAPAVDGVVEYAPPVYGITATFAADGPVEAPLIFAQPWSSDPASLLDMGNVQKELELIDEQKERIRDAQRKMHEGMQKHFTEMRELHTRRVRDLQDAQGDSQRKGRIDGGAGGRGPGPVVPRIAVPQIVEQPEEFTKSQERIKELRDQLAQDVEDVLLPHQKKRLDEITLRMKMKQRGTSGSLVDTELAKMLDIDEAQKERIRQRAMEVQKELEEKVAKLREEAREEILSELSPNQHRKLKDLLGAEFDDKPQFAPPRIRSLRGPDRKAKPSSEPNAEAAPKGEPAPKSVSEPDDRGS